MRNAKEESALLFCLSAGAALFSAESRTHKIAAFLFFFIFLIHLSNYAHIKTHCAVKKKKTHFFLLLFFVVSPPVGVFYPLYLLLLLHPHPGSRSRSLPSLVPYATPPPAHGWKAAAFTSSSALETEATTWPGSRASTTSTTTWGRG